LRAGLSAVHLNPKDIRLAKGKMPAAKPPNKVPVKAINASWTSEGGGGGKRVRRRQ